jgi:hypothetical protein
MDLNVKFTYGLEKVTIIQQKLNKYALEKLGSAYL